jgi:hypothetical protein
MLVVVMLCGWWLVGWLRDLDEGGAGVGSVGLKIGVWLTAGVAMG